MERLSSPRCGKAEPFLPHPTGGCGWRARTPFQRKGILVILPPPSFCATALFQGGCETQEERLTDTPYLCRNTMFIFYRLSKPPMKNR